MTGGRGWRTQSETPGLPSFTLSPAPATQPEHQGLKYAALPRRPTVASFIVLAALAVLAVLAVLAARYLER